MALNTGHLLLLSLLLVLSLAQLAFAHYSWHSEEDDWYNKFGKPNVYSGKKLYKKKDGGLYNGKPYYNENDTGGYNDVKTPSYKKPYKFSPLNKPYYKYKPSYNPKPVYKPKPKAKPIYTSPDAEPTYTSPDTKPYYKYKPSYNPKPVYKPKPIYTSPDITDPTYTSPDAEPTYTSPDTKPIYKKAIPDNKKPYSYYRNPVPEYESPASVPEAPAPDSSAPDVPAYTKPASSSEQEWLEPHNAARAEVGLPPMVWSDEVAQFAQSWANQRLASGCGLEHSGGPYGENIFWGSAGGYGASECVAAWVNEKQYYNYGDNSCAGGQDCGHYTQIIWANSIHLGCAKVQCSSGDVFMTCNYDPPGNYIGTKPY